MEPDFTGYATKAGIKCSDGRIITPEAFKHQDKVQVPLVWMHGHDKPENVLGHVMLEAVDDGVRCNAYFNATAPAQQAKELVKHKDINSLSIYANQLVEKSKQVLHGAIREVSLVLSGANPGALIDNVRIAHSDGDVETLDDEAIIFTGLELELSEDEVEQKSEVKDTQAEVVVHADADEKEDDETVEDVYDSLSEKQKEVVHFMIGAAVNASATEGGSAQHSADTTQDGDASSDETDNNEGDLTHQEGNNDMSNVFDQNATAQAGPTLSHDQLTAIVEDAKKCGSFKDAFLAHAATYGIEDIDLLFPDAKSVTSQPELISRRTEWVAGIIDGAKHTPFSRIKSLAADLTAEEARAKGYVKGNLKKDEVVKLLKRVTTPKMIYKKQKLDREDIIDITELDVVAWLKWEMRFMIEEEIARAVLIGDGREPDDDDKIDEDHLRPIAWDVDMYNTTITVPSNTSAEGYVEAIIRARKNYKGTGRPTFYTTDDVITDLLLIKDKMGRFVYDNEQSLADKLRVTRLVPVEVMEDEPNLVGVMVNIADYTIGADKGGSLSMFDDFDIDYNQYKYLIETRISGALTKPKSAVTLVRAAGNVVTPQTPAFNQATNTISVPNQTGVAYYDVTNPLSEVALTDGSDYVIDETTDVEARPESGYAFPHNTDADWTFTYVAP